MQPLRAPILLLLGLGLSVLAPAVFGDLLAQLNATTKMLVRQLMLQQFYSQERVRSDGCSGVKQVRHQRDGTRPYHTETHIGSGVASLHDHGNSIRTLGGGEFHAVLNGVEFRTRHVDYLLQMPSRSNSSNYHDVQDVPFPDVPPSVLEKATVAEQIHEMREYFRAFKNQDDSIRDYKPYFKPVLSYIEGAWIFTGERLEEGFPNERHWIKQETWEELEDMVRFTGYAGTKDALENLAFLPKAVVGIEDDTVPVLAQWTYRVLTHPLKDNLPLNRLHMVDDLATRMVSGLSMEEIADTREARFKLSPKNSDRWSHGRYIGTLLDDLMAQIPGKDNYGGNLTDEAFGHISLDPESNEQLNTAYYHHLFKYDTTDAMGMQVRHRGYSDETLFMAMTSRDKVAGMDFNNCMNDWANEIHCERYHQKWSYAVPLEIVYMTPLSTWNPYDIQYHGWAANKSAETVNGGGRDGSSEKPYDGTNSKTFYRTPAEFYKDEEYTVRFADTTGSDVYVLDGSGVKRKVRASGHRTFIPSIPGVGRVRQRYPIVPIHSEGTSVWKELAALKDIVLSPEKTHRHMFYANTADVNQPFYADCEMPPASAEYYEHTHEIELTTEDLDLLKEGQSVEKTSSLSSGHQHQLSMAARSLGQGMGHVLVIVACDGKDRCWDGHGSTLRQGFDNDWQFVSDLRHIDQVTVTGKPVSDGGNVANAKISTTKKRNGATCSCANNGLLMLLSLLIMM